MSTEILTNIFDKLIKFLHLQIAQTYEFRAFGVTLTSGLERLYSLSSLINPLQKGVNSPCHEITSCTGEQVLMFDSSGSHPSING